MKKLLVLLSVLLLSGCGRGDDGMERSMHLRTELLSKGCSFDAHVTADYGNKTYTFSAGCQADQKGNISFRVTKPESIAGISGRVEAEGGKMVFDEAVLAFDLKAEGLPSPVSAPWVMMKALRGGYVRSCGQEDGMIRLRIDDSFENDALHLDVWLQDGYPIRADIFEGNKRIMAMEIGSFEIG